MGYTRKNGRYADVEALILASLTTETADGNGSQEVELGDRRVVRMTLDVTASSGTSETLDVDIETSPDGVNWYVAGSFAQATGVTSERKTVAIDRYVRAAWDIGGTTPSFTFSLIGESA